MGQSIQYSLPTLNWLDFPATEDPVPVWPLPDVLRSIASAGCHGVGLDDASLAGFLGAGGTVEDVVSLLAVLDLKCTDVGVLRIGVGDSPVLAEALAQLATSTGAERCVTALYSPVSERVVGELDRCADVVSRAGATLAIEFASYGHLRTLGEAVALCDRVGWERCGVLLDLWHFVRGGEPWDALRALRADQIALVHLADAPEPVSRDLQYESRFRRLPPGTATFPTGKLVAMLQTLGYDGVVSAEVLSAELRTLPPEVGARRLVEALRTAWPSDQPHRIG